MPESKKTSKKENFTTIAIPTSLFNEIKERIKGTGFSTVSSYVTYVLKEILVDEEKEAEQFTKEEEEQIRARLRALGYID